MSITLYKYTAENNVVDKASYLTQYGNDPLIGTIRQGISVLDPKIEIHTDADLIKAYGTSFNYVYITDTNRYYYVTNVDTSAQGLFILSLHEDVLYTWKNSINGTKAIIDRTQSTLKGDLFLSDKNMVTDVNPYIMIKNFPEGFDTSDYVIELIATGPPLPDEDDPH